MLVRLPNCQIRLYARTMWYMNRSCQPPKSAIAGMSGVAPPVLSAVSVAVKTSGLGGLATPASGVANALPVVVQIQGIGSRCQPMAQTRPKVCSLPGSANVDSTLDAPGGGVTLEAPKGLIEAPKLPCTSCGLSGPP